MLRLFVHEMAASGFGNILETIGTVPAAVAAAIAFFEMIVFGENEVPFFAVIKIGTFFQFFHKVLCRRKFGFGVFQFIEQPGVCPVDILRNAETQIVDLVAFGDIEPLIIGFDFQFLP